MTTVIVEPDCGNAPKKTILRDYVIALAQRDKKAVLDAIDDAIEWEIVGRRTVRGRAGFEEELDQVNDRRVATVQLDSILTHGKEGAVGYTLTLASEHRPMRCCDLFVFSGHSKTATIKRITSYWIETEVDRTAGLKDSC